MSILEICYVMMLVVNFAALVYTLRRTTALEPTSIKSYPSIAPEKLPFEICNHWDNLQFGGREEVGGKKRVIMVCNKCGSTKIVEE